MTDVIEGTVVEDLDQTGHTPQSAAVAIRSHSEHSTELIAGSPRDRVEAATEMATALDEVIKKQGMRTKVGTGKVVQPDGTEKWVDRYHVNVEGWQTLATFLGLAVVPVWTRRVMDPTTGQPERVKYPVHEKSYHPKKQGGGLKSERTFEVDGYSWEARVECYKDGALIGAGEAMCSRSEGTWKARDDYALRGMAQTRATSRAIAGAARWIVTLAGYAATPAEEMPPEAAEPADAPAPAPVLPTWAEPATDKLRQTLDQALGFLLDVEPDDAAVGVVRSAMQVDCESDDVPRIAARAIVHLAKFVRERSDTSAPAGEPATAAAHSGSRRSSEAQAARDAIHGDAS